MTGKFKHIFRKQLMYITASAVIMSSYIYPVPSYGLGGFDLKSNIVSNPINEYRMDIAPGVTEKRYSFEGSDGKRKEVFVVNVDMKNASVSIEAGTPYNSDSIGLQTVKGQAEAVSYDNHRVVAAVNGDYYTMATGDPFGLVYKGGRPVRTNSFSTWRFFGITKDGKAVIGDMSFYSQIWDNLKEAIGGQAMLVKNGKPFETPVFNAGTNPYTAVGIKADGNVFFIAVDGRQEPYSSGISSKELTQLMIDMGAVTALSLDGGGSTTYLSRKPGEDILQVVNRPSDGSERRVANSWLIVSTAKSDHKFNYAFIEPYDKSYTPGSTVQFSYKGRDASLASAPILSSGLKWELSNSKYGRIDAKGKFTSNGKIGEVQVLLKRNGQTIGSTWIEIRHPDNMKFDSNEIIIAANSEKQLTLTAAINKRPLSLKPEDIEWKVTKGVGTVDKNGVFRASNNPVPGKITAKYKKSNLTAEINVSLGKKPENLYTFENGLGTWQASVVGRGEAGSIALSSNPAGPVRFENKALKMNFDFTGAQKQAILGVYGGPGSSMQIQGNPSSIGMWVYATPEAKGYFLKMAVIDANGTVQNLSLTSEIPGIDWTGWKYVEAKIPSSVPKPLYTHPTQTIRIMSTNSGITGPMTKGSIYIDNIRAVYENMTDDLYAPVIQSINVENKTYNVSSVGISAKITEYEADNYKTGINWSKTSIIVDGVDYSKKKGYLTYGKSGTVTLRQMNWSKGIHKVTVIAQDNFGNETTKTVEFTVK